MLGNFMETQWQSYRTCCCLRLWALMLLQGHDIALDRGLLAGFMEPGRHPMEGPLRTRYDFRDTLDDAYLVFTACSQCAHLPLESQAPHGMS